jgi:hypothetical protein
MGGELVLDLAEREPLQPQLLAGVGKDPAQRSFEQVPDLLEARRRERA